MQRFSKSLLEIFEITSSLPCEDCEVHPQKCAICCQQYRLRVRLESGTGAFFRAFENMDELDLVEYHVAGMPLHWKILNAARSGKCDWNRGQLTLVDG